ncbi:MAG: aerotolerance regulator BatA, partial [Anaerolineae bacterium]|nr:aerotolerance regulator BatA [Anaerolineae bacterium]
TQTVESDLDEATLQEIANLTDGRYFRAVDLSDLQQIYDQIDVLEQSDVERQVFVRWQEQGDLWLALGLALLIGERVLRQTVFQVIP